MRKRITITEFARMKGMARAVTIQADKVDRGPRPRPYLRVREPKRFQTKLHVFQDGQPGKEREGLKNHRLDIDRDPILIRS